MTRSCQAFVLLLVLLAPAGCDYLNAHACLGCTPPNARGPN
jgi:hypothetical protein